MLSKNSNELRSPPAPCRWDQRLEARAWLEASNHGFHRHGAGGEHDIRIHSLYLPVMGSTDAESVGTAPIRRIHWPSDARTIWRLTSIDQTRKISLAQ
jgi:hypothetical protein